MAWNIRGSRRYYIRKVWANGTCLSEYLGCGTISELAAQLDHAERRQARVRRATERGERQAGRELDRQIEAVYMQGQALTVVALLLAGYHQQQRQWRAYRDTEDSHNQDNDRSDEPDN